MDNILCEALKEVVTILSQDPAVDIRGILLGQGYDNEDIDNLFVEIDIEE